MSIQNENESGQALDSSGQLYLKSFDNASLPNGGIDNQ
jgi:hypothetical protein